jgi:glycosyltransferase involved in cell wall biosynthesis
MTVRANTLVSVIVRTKDRPGLLKTALKSIASQDYRPVEVILINDGGTDLDISTVSALLSDCTLTHIRFEKSRGRAAAGNEGILRAAGDFIGFLDDDDEFCPDHISTLVTSLEGSQYRVAYADSELVLREVDQEAGSSEIRDRRVFSSYDFSYVDLLSSNYIPLISILFSGEVLRQSGGFDEHFNLYEDWDLLLRIGEHFPFRHIGKVTSIYNQWNAGSQIAQSADQHLINAAFTQIFGKHRDKISPEVILNLNKKQESLTRELQEMIAKYISIEKELYKRYDELRQKDAEIERQRAEIHQKVAELDRKNAEVHTLTAQIDQHSVEAERLRNEIFHLRNAKDVMESTLGWQMLQKMRDIRDKMLPRETTRGKIYQKIINRLKGAGPAN